MKLYSSKPGASIVMEIDDALRALLETSMASFRPDYLVESGTHLGLGSTTMLAELAQKISPTRPAPLFTIEVNYVSWQQAVRNLQRFPHVSCRWGLSVRHADARRFILSDDAIRFHEREPDIYIDDVADPVRFYTEEVDGRLNNPQPAPSRWTRWLHYRENWLPRLLRRPGRPLVALDSAGAIGFLEFTTVRQILRDRPYLILLDDIDHLKHFRSRREIAGDSRFTILGESPGHGWLLAAYQPNRLA